MTGGSEVVFAWTLDDGTTQTQTLTVKDGPQGPAGTTPTLIGGTTTTLGPDEPATSEVVPDPDVPGQYKVNLGIPQGQPGEVPIDDTTTSATSVWSSQKISDTLKLTADVAVTPITALASGVTQLVLSGSGNSHYQVVNGICYFQLYVTVHEAANAYFDAITGLPKPKTNTFFAAAPFANATSFETVRVNISTVGTMRLSHGVVGGMYMITGSYPVA